MTGSTRLIKSTLNPEQKAALPGWGTWVIDAICVRDDLGNWDGWASFGIYLDECRKHPALAEGEVCCTDLIEPWGESLAMRGFAADVDTFLRRASAPLRSLREALAGARHD